MPYKSIFNSPTQPTGNKDYANDFVPGQYAKVNAGIAATHTAPIKAPKIQAATPPNGPTGFWNRITEVGVGKVNLANLGKVIQKKPTVQSNSLKTDIHGAEKVGKGIGSFVKNTAVNTAKATERVPADVTLAVANPIQRKLGVHQTTPQDLIKNKNNSSVLRGGAMEGAKGTLKQTAGDVIQTGTLATGGEGKVAEVTGEDLLKTFGTKGVQDLADKAGVDLAGKGSIEGAKEVAQTKVAQQAFNKTSSNALTRATKSSAKGALGFGTFNAAQEASAGGSNKQIVKAGETGAKQGAVLGAGASLLKSGVKAVTNKTPTIEKGTAPKEDVTPSPVTKLGTPAQSKTESSGLERPTTSTPQGQNALTKIANQGSLSKMYSSVKSGLAKTTGKTVSLFKAQPSTIETAQKTLGTDVKGYTHTVDDYAIEHTLKNHPNLTKKDINNIPDIISTPDHIYNSGKTDQGLDTLTYHKQIDGHNYYVQEVRTGKQQLAMKTMYKQENPDLGRTDAVYTAPVPTSESRSPGGSTNIVANNTTNVKKGMDESGAVAPGQAVKDVQDLIDKHQATTKYSGDIQRGGDEVEGAKKQIASDAVKVAKNTPSLNPVDKKILQDYRDNKEAGLPTNPLPQRLQKTNDDITSLNKAALSAKQEQANLEGKEYTDNVNPETYTHREAQGKGSMFDRLVQGTKSKIPSGTSFAKRTPSDKGRVYQAVTDEDGNRQVVAVKNESFGKVKHLTGFDENQKPVQLGKYSADGDTLTNAKGKQLKLSQATTSEITKASGQKYYTDPHLTSLKNYVDSRTALENVKFIESIKNHPDFEKFASPPDTTAPKGYEPVHGLFQFQGYKFEPKTAEALRDIVKNSSDEVSMADKVGNVLKRTIVYFPLKHNLNQTATYAVDRGLSSLANPAAYYRGAKSLVKAFGEVTNQGPVFQKLQKAGFELPSADDKAFTNYVTKELKGASADDPRVVEIAKSFGTSPARLYKAIQHTAVWQYGDILNVARVMERMEPKLLSKGQDFESAMKQTEKYSLQYKVPSRVGPTKLGRSVSRTLQSPKVFFGRYRYDLYKIMGNTIKDTVNLKTLAKGGKENLQAVDKLAAMAFGAAMVWPLVDKGLQKASGNPNAYMSAPGALQIPETAEQVASGKKTPETAAASQVYPSPAVTVPLEVQANRDSFTGKQIYDPNASEKQKMSQIGTWIKGQSSFGEKASAVGKTKGNKAVDTILSLAGTNMPSNSTQTNKLYSLQYDSLPNVQTQAKAQAKQGNFDGAQKTIESYDKQVLTAATAALKASKQPVPSDSVLIKKLKTSGAYYAPKEKTIRAWKTKQPSNAKTLLGL